MTLSGQLQSPNLASAMHGITAIDPIGEIQRTIWRDRHSRGSKIGIPLHDYRADRGHGTVVFAVQCVAVDAVVAPAGHPQPTAVRHNRRGRLADAADVW